MKKIKQKEVMNIVNHFEKGSNCTVINGVFSGCVFTIPANMVEHEQKEE